MYMSRYVRFPERHFVYQQLFLTFQIFTTNNRAFVHQFYCFDRCESSSCGIMDCFSSFMRFAYLVAEVDALLALVIYFGKFCWKR